MAYSDKINGVEYKKLRVWLSMKKILQFLVLSGVVFISLYFSGHCSLLETLLLSGIFAWWWFKRLQIIEFFEPDWEGTVVDKYAKMDVKHKWILDEKRARLIFLGAFDCTLAIKRNSDGKIYKIKYLNYIINGFDTNVKYFRQGETVRHHRCLPLYEKLDKSKERKLICFKCGRFVDKYEEKCWHCGLPVLSEETEYVKKTHTLFDKEKRSDRIW